MCRKPGRRWLGGVVLRVLWWGRAPLAVLVLAALALQVLVFALPLPERLGAAPSTMVLYRDGTPAHVFLAPDERWRVAVPLDEIDPDYLSALVRFEDKRFFAHPGVDPVAVARAAWLNLTHGRVVSGGSTLTMQLVRVVEPRPRTLGSKAIEAFRAFQLEQRLTKEEILLAYVTFAPFGRNVEGVEAASLAYFGHRAQTLSAAEIAALLAVPQNPSRYPSARNEGKLRAARDHVAAFLADEGLLPDQTPLDDVIAQPVPPSLRPFPREAPHAAAWLRGRGTIVRTTLDAGTQRSAERLLWDAHPGLVRQGVHNAAAVVVDHHRGEVRALVGNPDFWDAAHGGQIAGFAVPRSPGSALKPFLYAAAIDEGRALPEHLVEDVPVRYGSYAPRNYDERFDGLVRFEEALSRSLNIPFVLLLQEVGVPRFLETLTRMGARSLSPDPGHYGLSLVAGGIELTPLEVAGLYATLAAEGRYRPLRVLPGEEADPIEVFSPGATWLTRRALTMRDRPDFPTRSRVSALPAGVAWKTGTSFGHRDAWSAGWDRHHTAVVWAGNFDNAASRGLVGAEVAAPILFDLLDAVGAGAGLTREPGPPADLARVEVCGYSGRIPGEACPHTREVLAPRTSVPTERCPFHAQVEVDVETGLAVDASCRGNRETRTDRFLVWPAGVRRFLGERHHHLPEPPSPAEGCGGRVGGGGPAIVSPQPGQVALLVPGVPVETQHVPFEADAGWPGARLSWFVNGAFLGTVGADETVWWRPEEGEHEVLVVDERGRAARQRLKVRRREG